MNKDDARREAARAYKREYRRRQREQKKEDALSSYGGPFYVHLHHQDGFCERIKEYQRSVADQRLLNCRRLFGADLVRSFIGTLEGVPV